MNDYVATFVLGNTLFELPLRNHDDPERVVEAHAHYLADKLGVTCLYVQTKEEHDAA